MIGDYALYFAAMLALFLGGAWWGGFFSAMIGDLIGPRTERVFWFAWRAWWAAIMGMWVTAIL